MIQKLVNPATYTTAWSNFMSSSAAYYKPVFRSSSATPLWHFMLLTSVVMYTASYQYKGIAVQQKRQDQKKALEEYYAKHGGGGH